MPVCGLGREYCARILALFKSKVCYRFDNLGKKRKKSFLASVVLLEFCLKR